MRIDNGFTFAGQHSLMDMGLICVKSKKRKFGGDGTVDSYAVGGMSGTMAFSDRRQMKAYAETVTLYAKADLDDETAAQTKWRTVRAWLMAGRRTLVWDSEPGVAYKAEVSKIEAVQSEWVDEGLSVTFTVQPDGRAAQLFQASGAVPSSSTPYTVQLGGVGNAPAPVSVRVKNEGTRRIYDFGYSVNGRDASVSFSKLYLLENEELIVTMETPISAVILRTDGTTENALAYAETFQRVQGVPGQTLRVRCTYRDTGTANLTVQAEMRGRVL